MTGGNADAMGGTESGAALDQLQDTALRLLAGLNRPPRSMKLRNDGAEIQLEWPEQAAAASTAPVLGPADATAPVTAPAATDDGAYLTAEMVGAFYHAPEPGAAPFVQVGDAIRQGQQIGIIEAMKLMIPAEAAVAGTVRQVLVADGAMVEYGDRLFLIDPTHD
ncbi:acetyl-CoA carboxylase biotin carboxyl carrier protein [Couchioplanes azureus]|uniref:acetyl-CoA carboxylase biotin carboxyl carrier protein n=1 Tax=Couchioplanes caeruleus TaxID=56438 RepID=UPI0016702678|nr:biotin/lipoyl-containing protein [Couchioplanes caeruleus]GGQ86310.1 hypothetical protein GCM10010166_65640 [Couchioplanes caeruleus subsp. azureus]